MLESEHNTKNLKMHVTNERHDVGSTQKVQASYILASHDAFA